MFRYFFVLLALTGLAVAQPSYLVQPDRHPEVSKEVARQLGQAFHSAAEVSLEEAGPAPEVVAAADVEPDQGGRKLRVRAFAYCLRGRTASGTYVKPGTIAVDPRVIPLGTRLYVPGYGYGTALDTGGAIKGNKIDLWLPTARECYQWGVRTVTITVLD